MSADGGISLEVQDSPKRAWKRATLPGQYLRTAQRLHAAVMTLVPLGGTLLAAWQVFHHGLLLLDLALLVGMYSLTIAGITVGFHRHLSHLAFQAHPSVRAVLAVAGSMAGQGPVIYWVANHRRHHQYSDQPGDPHSPFFKGERPLGGIRGLWHAQTGWNFDHALTNTFLYCKDLLRDPLISRINRSYHGWVALGLLLPAAVGGSLT